MVDLQLQTTASVTQPWQGGLAPDLPPPTHPTLSLAYRLCLAACQPRGRDSILFWYTVKKYSNTFFAAKLWRRQNLGRAVRGMKKKITTCLAQCQVRKVTGLKKEFFSFYGFFSWTLMELTSLKTIERAIMAKEFLFLQHEDISEGRQVLHMCCEVNLLIVSQG